MRRIIGKILNFIFNSGHNHPYLEEIGCHSYPDNHWGGIDGYKPFACLSNLFKQRRKKRKTKVDPRDCWGLDDTFYGWLYEHLCQYVNDTNANLTFHKFEHNGITYTEGEYIDYLKELCVKMINYDEFEGCPELDWDYIHDEKNNAGTIKWKNSQEELDLHRKIWTENAKRHDAMRKELCNVFCDLLPYLWW